ncbi:hypothetical protein DFH06DRAFT_954284, partial [Mycena polygramma]
KTEPVITRLVMPAPGAIVEGRTYDTEQSAIDDIFYHEEQRGHKWALAQRDPDTSGQTKKRTVRCNHYRAPQNSRHSILLDPSDYRQGKTIRTNCMARVNINRSAGTGLWRLTTVDLVHNHARQIPEGGAASRAPNQHHQDIVKNFTHPSFSRAHIAKVIKSQLPNERPLEDRQISNLLNKARRDTRANVEALGGDTAAI